MLLADNQIREIAANGAIEPFVDKSIRYEFMSEGIEKKVISYGLSSYGYDIRLSDRQFFIQNQNTKRTINPKDFDINTIELAKKKKDACGDYFVVPSNSYAVGVSREKLKMPSNMTGIIKGKSTYSRCGLILNATPIEADWEGYLTLSFNNCSKDNIRVYANEGIAQILFLEGSDCDTSYEDRKGKYQNQSRFVTLAKI